MAAELHLAENALALHLLLQHFEGLVDIVVADENLHAMFLFASSGDWARWPGRSGHWRRAMRSSAAGHEPVGLRQSLRQVSRGIRSTVG